MPSNRSPLPAEVSGDRHGRGSCPFSRAVGADLQRDQAGDDHQEPDGARDLPTLPRREKAAVGRRVLDRRLFRQHRRPTREREDDRRLRQETRLGLPEAPRGPPAGAVLKYPVPWGGDRLFVPSSVLASFGRIASSCSRLMISTLSSISLKENRRL